MDALPDNVIDYALAERPSGQPGADKPHEAVMIEQALIRFRGDKSETARFIGWTPDDTLKRNRPQEWTLTFRHDAHAWKEAA